MQGEEYELSANEFVIPAGESTASITVTPKNNFEDGKTIKLELYPVDGYVLGEYNFTLIEVLTKGQLICSFQEENYVLPGEVEIRMDAKMRIRENIFRRVRIQKFLLSWGNILLR